MKPTFKQIVIALVVIAVIYILRRRFASASRPKTTEGWTVYGVMGCSWTRKQLKHLESKKVPYKFVDCEKGGCDGKTAFPTLVSPSGEEIVGYTEI